MTTNERTDLGLTDSAAGCSCCSTASATDMRCRIDDHTGGAGRRDDVLALRDERHRGDHRD